MPSQHCSHVPGPRAPCPATRMHLGMPPGISPTPFVLIAGCVRQLLIQGEEVIFKDLDLPAHGVASCPTCRDQPCQVTRAGTGAVGAVPPGQTL